MRWWRKAYVCMKPDLFPDAPCVRQTRLKGNYNSDELRKLPIIIIINSARSAPIFHFQLSMRLFKKSTDQLKVGATFRKDSCRDFVVLMKTSRSAEKCDKTFILRVKPKSFMDLMTHIKKSTKKGRKNNCLKFFGRIWNRNNWLESQDEQFFGIFKWLLWKFSK